MEEIFANLLKILYLSTGLITIVGYWPTIKDLYRRKPSASAASYKIWTFESGIALLYSLLMLDDILVQISMAVTFACCALILALRLRMKGYKEKIWEFVFGKG